jgi:A/G-specific adenine glycosylase
VPPEDWTAAPAPAASFAERVVDWQRSHGRSELPWQNTHDPYCVWLSEVMLQQTQVSTVLNYFARFLERFPTVDALAAGTEDEVFGLWSGLGYYSRARNMHRCAQEVIGRSTAAAIAAFCFGERVAILDGNVKRVLARLLAFGGDLSATTHERALWAKATELLPPAAQQGAIASYTQGLMDLGATVCLPRKPSCMICPVGELCAARCEGAPERFPVKTRKLRRSAQSLWMLQACDARGRVWLEKRPSRGIWAGLYCLPVYESRALLLDELAPDDRRTARDDAAFVHVLTHKDLHLHPVIVKCAAAQPLNEAGEWFEAGRWSALGLPAPVRKLLTA